MDSIPVVVNNLDKMTTITTIGIFLLRNFQAPTLQLKVSFTNLFP